MTMRPWLRRFGRLSAGLLLVGLLSPSGLAYADDPGVAQVAIVKINRGSIPEILTAYGTAAPALEGGNAVSLPQDGRVAAILVTPGDRVHVGDRLLEFDLAAAGVSTYQQALSALNLTQAERAHTAQLLAQKLATRDQLAQAKKAYLDAKATLDALRRQGADKPRSVVTAPYDGVVNTIPVAQGDRVAAGAALMTLTRLDGKGVDGLVVTVGVEPALHARVQPGQNVVLHRPGGGADIAGHVVRVDGVLNVKTRLVDVDISVPTNAVLAGEVFRADIALGDLPGWIVPHGAVLSDDKGDYVFQVDAGKARRVDVHSLGTHAGEDAVSGNLDPALPVVTDGATQIADGDKVQLGPPEPVKADAAP